MLPAQVIINLALAIVALGIIAVAGTLAYGLGTPKQPAGFILSLLLTIAAMSTIGLWISAFARSAAVASGIGQLILYPSLFFAGLGLPREVMPGVLRDIGDWTPLGATVQAMQSSMQGHIPIGSVAAGNARLCPAIRLCATSGGSESSRSPLCTLCHPDSTADSAFPRARGTRCRSRHAARHRRP